MLDTLPADDHTVVPMAKFLGLSQIGFASFSERDDAIIKRSLRLEDASWREDDCAEKGSVLGYDGPIENKVKRLFNHDYGIEIEIVRYITGPNYLELSDARACAVCHLGFLVKDGETLPVPGLPLDEVRFPFQVIQRVETVGHATPQMVNGLTRYRHTIYASGAFVAVHLKIIEAIEDRAAEPAGDAYMATCPTAGRGGGR